MMLLKWIERIRQREDQLFLFLTLVIGAAVGMVVVAFIVLTERLGSRMYPAEGAAWRRVIIPILGSLITGYLLHRYFPEARGSGIPQTKAALFAQGGRISLRTVLGKFFCSSASLASGIALGREGPSVQVGAGIASVIGRAIGLRRERIESLIPIGASAALAAAFNTPIAAVLFSLEEVMGNLHAPLLGSVVLSSATAWMVLHLMLGDEPLFRVPTYQLVHPLEFCIYALLGLIGGLVSVCFVKSLLWMREHFRRMPKWTSWFQPVAGGLIVGLLGWFVPGVLGVGYSYVGQALNGKMALQAMAILVALKLLATTTCYASGNAGGIFGPSLFIGAMMGGTLGSVAHLFMPEYTGAPGAYALVGMGTAFAGIIRAPLTSVIMIFELTRDYTIIVPLMISNLISFSISYRLQRQPIYEALAFQDGIHLPAAETRGRQWRLRVRHAMRAPVEVFSPQMTLSEALEKVRRSKWNAWPVGDNRGLIGVVSAIELERAINEGLRDRKLEDILDFQAFPHVHADQPLDLALERMGAAQLDVLPVVSRANIRQMEGVVTMGDILKLYGLNERGSPH